MDNTSLFVIIANCGITSFCVNLSWYKINCFLLQTNKGIWVYAYSVPVRFMLKETICRVPFPFFIFIAPNIITLTRNFYENFCN